ncbi:SDR family NAD(P)-dependent oxidoreductase [Cryptosporangium phraense]|uniref:SDR family oxidoreductase n=1 Tax=Cryptosporangium phraense TaxID=2593070 RepID=A0A545AVC2_9ACTN|nr:SDR family oxidoreductase [Cryptosporangium phraense]TQS45231.1 SDR family oxidoreductase [Cryptosporangium phraense]
MDLTGRHALITGGSRGIGRAIALALADVGADVAITYVRDEEAASETAGKTGGPAYRASIADLDQTADAVERAAADLGGLDLVVSNAGIASRGHTVVDTDPAELEKVLRVHALGPHRLAQVALPHLRRAARSDLVFISSIAARTTPPGGAPYTMGKAAAEALAHTLAREERAHGVHVNIVAPGLVDTEMGFRLARATAGVADIREVDATSPFGHVCSPAEVADAVIFLVTTGYVTDHRLTVDGGAGGF